MSTIDEKLKEIESLVDAAEADGSFYLRVETWLTAGDGRQFCAQAPDTIRILIAMLRKCRSQRDEWNLKHSIAKSRTIIELDKSRQQEDAELLKLAGD